MTTYIEDGGKFYTVEGGRVVAAANTKEELMPAEAKPVVVGDRVETEDGRLGHAVSSVITVYGKVLGIRLDGGDFENHFPETLKHSDVEPTPEYDDVVQQLLAEVDEYEQQVAETLPEIEIKAKTARALNIRAKALMSDPTLPLSDQIKVDAIITTTGYDIGSLKQDAQNAELASEYVTRQPRYHLADEITPTSSFSREDASWLQVEADLVQEEIEGVDWDAYLTEQAVGLAERLEVTDDEELLKDAISNHFARVASHAFSGDAYRERLASFTATVKEAVGDDYQVNELHTPEDFAGAGDLFMNCLKSYVNHPGQYYTVLSPQGKPIAAVRVKEDGSLEAYGPQNRPLSPQHEEGVRGLFPQARSFRVSKLVETSEDTEPDFLWA